VTITGNICIDCDSTGIYINSDASGFTVVGNIIESCSGGGSNGYVIAGGIVLSGAGKKICSGNYINNTGKTTAGVTRVLDTPGTPNNPINNTAIRINRADGTVVSDNIIKGCTGSGIEVYLATYLVDIHNNQIENCPRGGIYLASTYGANQKGIFLRGNTIDQSVGDGHGIYDSGGGSSPDVTYICDNVLIGKKAGTNKNGIRVEGQGHSGELRNNKFNNWDYGLLTATQPATSRYGVSCVMEGNKFVNNTTGWYYIPPNTYAFHKDTLYLGNTTNETDAYAFGTVKAAVSITPFKVFYAGAAPTAQTWAVGDRAIRQTPAVGQPKAWVCTVAGTPGTWVSEGNL
jgi:hypothetical protein